MPAAYLAVAMAAAGDIMATAASIEDKLRSKLDATEVVSAGVPRTPVNRVN